MQLLFVTLSQVLVIHIVGVGLDTDSYLAAQAVPSVLIAMVTSVLQSVWLSRLTILSDDVVIWRKEQSILQGQTALLGGGLFLLAGLSITLWLPFLYPTFEAEQQQIIMEFCLLMLVAALINTQSALLTVAMRARNRILIAELVALLGTLFSFVCIYFAVPVWGLNAAVWINLARAILVYVVQLSLANWPPISLKNGWACKETWTLMKPMFIASVVYKSSPIVDRYFASLGKSGDITILGISQMIINGLSTITERSIGINLSLKIIQMLKSNNKNANILMYFQIKFIQVAILSAFMLLLLLTLSSNYSGELGSLFCGGKENGAELIKLLIGLIPFYVVSSLGSALTQYYSFHKDIKILAIVGIVGNLAGILVKGLGYFAGGVLGLVVSISLSSLLNMLVNYAIIKKKYA